MLELVKAGGWLMLPILLCSVIALAIIGGLIHLLWSAIKGRCQPLKHSALAILLGTSLSVAPAVYTHEQVVVRGPRMVLVEVQKPGDQPKIGEARRARQPDGQVRVGILANLRTDGLDLAETVNNGGSQSPAFVRGFGPARMSGDQLRILRSSLCSCAPLQLSATLLASW